MVISVCVFRFPFPPLYFGDIPPTLSFHFILNGGESVKMKKILVIDDNKTTLAMAKQAIGDEFSVIAVISGYQSLKYLER